MLRTRVGYFTRLLQQRDLAVCDELLAADYVDHGTPVTTPPGPAATKEYVAQLGPVVAGSVGTG